MPTAAACGLAVLTKGPIGVALPGLVILLYFAWNRELGRLFDWRLLGTALVFVLVAGPWYGLVANETRGEWVKAFIAKENLQRFANPMDQHDGPFYYYLIVLPVMFAPWSAFLLAVLWYGIRGTTGEPHLPDRSPGGGASLLSLSPRLCGGRGSE